MGMIKAYLKKLQLNDAAPQDCNAWKLKTKRADPKQTWDHDQGKEEVIENDWLLIQNQNFGAESFHILFF